MANDPLPSWNGGAAKAAIVDFVARVTKRGGADFVAPADRVATFDNDGTLWCEQPVQVQVFFAMARLHALAEKDPTIREREPFKAFLDHDLEKIHALGKDAVFEMAFATHAGVTDDEFDAIATAFLASAKHPKVNRLFTRCTYRPQIELLEYLRANGFRTFIVSGGGIDLIRAFAEEAYGVMKEHVVGSSVKTRFEIRDGRAVLVKLADLQSFDDRDVKPQNIRLHIGRRPILAFGNSDGDLPMLRYAKASEGASLALLLHHDDGDREFVYDREFRLSPLVDALDNAKTYGLEVVSMKRDWNRVFDDA